MKLSVSTVNELVDIIDILKETVGDTATKYSGSKFNFQFTLQSAPLAQKTDSEIFSALEALASAVRKFPGDQKLGWGIGCEVYNQPGEELGQTIQARLEAKESLKQQLSAPKLAVLPQK